MNCPQMQFKFCPLNFDNPQIKKISFLNFISFLFSILTDIPVTLQILLDICKPQSWVSITMATFPTLIIIEIIRHHRVWLLIIIMARILTQAYPII